MESEGVDLKLQVGANACIITYLSWWIRVNSIII